MVNENRKEEYIKDAYVVVEKGKNLTENSYAKKRLSVDKLIAPSAIWNEKYSLYKDIISKKFIMIDDYSEYLTEAEYLYLQSEDLIYLSPIIIKKHPSKLDLKLLLKKAETNILPLNETGEMIEIEFEYSDIAYLTRSDDNVLAKTADSFKSAKSLLKFLLSQVIVNDLYFNKTTELKTEKGSLFINNCLWAFRLRDTQWVPVKSDEDDKQNSEKPSVGNITELIRDDTEILRIN